MWRFSLILVAISMSSPAYGQISTWQPGTCISQSAAENILQEQYKERTVAGGITNGGKLAEIWVSEKGTWTVTLRLSVEKVCLIGSGEDWRNYPQELEGEVL